jgi:hypothetical protein
MTTRKTDETKTDSIPEDDSKIIAKLLPISVGDPAAADPFAIDQSHMEEFASEGEEKSSDIQFGKPPKGIYFTVPVETAKPWKNRAFYFLLEIKDRDPFLVAPAIAKLKVDEDVLRPVLIVRYVTMAGEEGLWALKLDKPNAKENPYNKTALKILAEAEKGWVRLISGKGHYRHKVSPTKLEKTPPKYSNQTFKELIDLQFGDRKINGLDHEIWTVLDEGSET